MEKRISNMGFGGNSVIGLLSGVGRSVDERGQEMIGRVIVLDKRKNKNGKGHLVMYKIKFYN